MSLTLEKCCPHSIGLKTWLPGWDPCSTNSLCVLGKACLPL